MKNSFFSKKCSSNNLSLYKKILLLSIFFIFYIGSNAQMIFTSRVDFEKEGFGAMMPIGGVNVKGDHFYERYEPLYEGSKVKLLNYKVSISAKKNNETELAFIEALKINSIKDGMKVREDISTVKNNRSNAGYRSLKLIKGKINSDHFFLFRNDDIVLLSYEYLTTKENNLSDAVNSAVNQFIWLVASSNVTIKEIGATLTIPGELNATLNKTKTKLLFTLKDSTLTKRTKFKGSIENLGELGKIDTAKIKKELEKNIKSLPKSRLVYKFNNMNYGTNNLIDKYKIEFVENNILTEMYVFDIYTSKTMFRYTTSGADEYYSKTSLFLEKLLRSIKSL